MKVELKKNTEADGKVFFLIYVDDTCKKAYSNEEEAKECYQRVVDFGAWEKTESLMVSETTNLNP